MFDPATQRYTTISSLPRRRFAHSAAAGPDGRIYVAGGAESNQTVGSELNIVDIYDPSTETWTEGAPMPTPRMFVGLAFGKDGLLYALGGGASEQVFTGLRVSTVLNVLEIYDPAANRWMQGAPAPTPREWPGTGFVLLPDGHLAAHGGLGLGTSASGAGVIYPTAFETYDPASNTWTARQPLPEPAPGMASLAVSGGLLYAFGGYVAADDVTAPFHPSLAIYKWV